MLDSLVRVSRRVLRVPKTESSQTGGVCPRTPSRTVVAGPGPATRGRQGKHRVTGRACDGPDANESRGSAPISLDDRRASGSGTREPSRGRNASRSAAPGLRSAPNGSRRPTRRRSARVRRTFKRRREASERTTDERRHARHVHNCRRRAYMTRRDESPHSNFRVSQVYP